MATRLRCRPGPGPRPIPAGRNTCRPSSLAALAPTLSTTPVRSGAATDCTAADVADERLALVMEGPWTVPTCHQYRRRCCTTPEAAPVCLPISSDNAAVLASGVRAAHLARTPTPRLRLMDSHIDQIKYTLSPSPPLPRS
jgi:hypothetical protein